MIIPLNTSPFSRAGSLVKAFPRTWLSLPGTRTLCPNSPGECCEFGGRCPRVPRLQLSHFHHLPHPPSSCCCADPVPRISFLHWRQTLPFSPKMSLYNVSSEWPHPRSFLKANTTFSARRGDEAQAAARAHSVCSLTTSSLFLSLSFNRLHVICIV